MTHTLQQRPSAEQAASNAERPSLHALPARRPAPRRPPCPHTVGNLPYPTLSILPPAPDAYGGRKPLKCATSVRRSRRTAADWRSEHARHCGK